MTFVRVCCLVALALALGAAPASAHFPQSIDATVAPNGESIEASSPVPATATSATITSTPSSAEDETIFNNVTKVLASSNSPKDRLLSCIGMYLGLVQAYGTDSSYERSDPSLQLLFLNACLSIAFGLQQQARTSALAGTAAAGCPRQDFRAPMKVTRRGGKYHLKVSGKSAKLKKRSPLVVVCKHKGTGVQITLKPRSRRKKLKQVLGSKLTIGYLNPANGNTLTIHTTFAVH